MTIQEAYSALPFEARRYALMARLIDEKKADAFVLKLAENYRRNEEILQRLKDRKAH